MKKIPIYLTCLVVALLAGVACSNNPKTSMPETTSSVSSDAPASLPQTRPIESASSVAESVASEEPEPLASSRPMLPSSLPPSSSEAESSQGGDPSDPAAGVLKIHVVDTEGNPVPELHVLMGIWHIDNLAGYTDENGDAFWSSPRVGKETIELGNDKVKASQAYKVQITEDLAPLELVWDHANPAFFPPLPGPTVTMKFLDRNNQPAVGVAMSISMLTMNGVSLGDMGLPMLCGPSDQNGVYVFTNPIAGTYGMYVTDKNHEHYKFELAFTDEYAQTYPFVLNDPIPED